MKYRKKPVEVEAVDAWQWWPPSDSRHNSSMLSNCSSGIAPGDLFMDRAVPDVLEGTGEFMLRTIKGDVIVSPGDWIITRGIGDRVLCEPGTFDVTYEAVEEPADSGYKTVAEQYAHLPSSIEPGELEVNPTTIQALTLGDRDIVVLHVDRPLTQNDEIILLENWASWIGPHNRVTILNPNVRVSILQRTSEEPSDG